eukprot:TRINITY_DN11539_c0_g1_i2.p1 TRINITY_DN11539_c0_g1~~TRINITY_DN11539_c0_g1_i2.p1  ORF type:complete len:254 (+),score=34.17 TRINITY_DN11539_c0_g1_i2:195-956(+)
MATKTPESLYSDYKEQRAERRRKAVERRGEKPNAHWDLPLLAEDFHEEKPGLRLASEYQKPDWYQAPIQDALLEAAAEAAAPIEPTPVEVATHVSAQNQWTDKHVQEDHDYYVNRQWTRHIRDVHRASPLFYEEQEAEARRVAAKQRERENARAPYPYSYRGVEQPSAHEPFHYPYHQGQVQHTVTAHQSLYDQRYGNSLATQSSRSFPVTFIKHKNPRSHAGRAADPNDFIARQNPSGYEPAAQAAYAGIWQ